MIRPLAIRIGSIPIRHVPVRGYAGFGMSSIWSKISNGFSKTEAMISKLRAQKDTPATSTTAVASAPPSQTTTPQKTAPPAKEHKKPKIEKPVKGGVWDAILTPRQVQGPPPTELWMETPFFRGSTQKLNELGRQIAGLPLDAAILQMRFSPKKPAKEVLELLCKIRLSLEGKGARPSEFYVRMATVGRGTYIKRIDIKGRGRFGIMWKGHRFMRLCVHKPDPQKLVKKLLRIKKFPREDKPVLRKLDY